MKSNIPIKLIFLVVFNAVLNCSFYDQLSSVFEEKPDWDTQNKYSPDNLNVYFKNHDTNRIYRVDVRKSLAEVLKNKK